MVGPHTANFQEEVKALSAIGALQIIADETEFFSEVTYLLENDQKRRELGLRARRFIKALINRLARKPNSRLF